MFLKIFLAFLFYCGAVFSAKKSFKLHPDAGLDIYGLAKNHGYPLETHEVVTKDGYILTLHRIPHGRNNSYNPNKKVVLIMHGLISCSTDWLSSGPNKSLPYILAERGYDVWLGNARGNAESRKHTTLDPDVDGKEFWSFSWHEIGMYDLPATIDYILTETKQKKLHYIGFSQGTTSFLVMASSIPEYNDKIKLATLMAPTAIHAHTQHPLMRLLAPFEQMIMPMLESLGIREIMYRSRKFTEFVMNFCQNGMPTQEICKGYLWLLAGGVDREQLEDSLLPVIFTNMPAGANIKQPVHYIQCMAAKEFRHWNYHDDKLNLKAYGQVVPPKYRVDKITAPVAMYSGANDWMAAYDDAVTLASEMPNIVHLKLVNSTHFNHVDFMIAKDIVELVYNEALSIMEQYN